MVRKTTRKKKIEQDNDFYYPERKVHLYDADAFIAQLKHLMLELVPDTEFAVYFGINENDCLDAWIRDENGVMYQVEPKQLEHEESEISLTEVEEDEDPR